MKPPLRILHLEDNPTDAELIQAILETEGIICDVTRVDTQADFFASIEQGGFDLILTDYTLPSFDGLSALKIALEKCPDVPFIFVSGTLGEEVAVEALKIGATDYILKQRLSRIAPSVHRALREAKERGERKRAEALLSGRETASRNDRQRHCPLYDPRMSCAGLSKSCPQLLWLRFCCWIRMAIAFGSAQRRAFQRLYRRNRRWTLSVLPRVRAERPLIAENR